MHTIDIHEAKTHLARLVKDAAAGEPFIITVEGKPMVRVTSVATTKARTKRRVDFMERQIKIPDDFDRMGSAEIETLFEGGSGGD